jgi:hypothetical protein
LIAPFRDRRVGLVQGRTVPNGPRRPNDRSIDVSDERGLYESCNIAYRRTALEAVGGFDESFGRRFSGRPFGEDTDLAWRVRRAGWRTAFATDAIVRHHVFPGSYRKVLAEEWRRRQFPWLIRQIPELRDHLPGGRWGLRAQSARSQAAVAGVVVAAVSRRPEPLVACLPYAGWLLRRTRRPSALARQVVTDAVGSAALVAGSVRERTVLL